MKRYLVVYGTRPQMIKVQMLIDRLDGLELEFYNTGQHYSSVLIQDDIAVRQDRFKFNSGNWGELLDALIKKIKDAKFDGVIVIGDTNSTLIGAVAASIADVDVYHVESGLRSGDIKMPEERNRRAVDGMSKMLFTVNEESGSNLVALAANQEVVVSGDLMQENFDKVYSKIAGNTNKNRVLMTIHRSENKSIEKLINLKALISHNKDRYFIWPLHPSMDHLIKQLKFDDLPNLEIIEPLDYLSMLQQLKLCEFVVTDSGGVQREAYWAGKYSFIARSSTEWLDILEDGKGELLPLSDKVAMIELRPKLLGHSTVLLKEKPSLVIKKSLV